MNKNQKQLTLVFLVLLLCVEGMFYGNYDYSQMQQGQNTNVVRIGLFPLLLLVFLVWFFFYCITFVYFRSEKT